MPPKSYLAGWREMKDRIKRHNDDGGGEQPRKRHYVPGRKELDSRARKLMMNDRRCLQRDRVVLNILFGHCSVANITGGLVCASISA